LLVAPLKSAVIVTRYEDARTMNHEERKTSYLVWALALVGAPCVALVAPLFFHTSTGFSLGSVSRGYAEFVACTAAVALAFTLTVSVRSFKRQSLILPLYFDFLVVLGLVSVLASEVILTRTLKGKEPFDELRVWGHKRSPFFGFEPAPNNSWGEGLYTTDRFGFRTHVGGSWEDSKGPRIFTLGESSVFGYRLANDQTWPHLLEADLRTRFHSADINVVNAGANAFNILQSLLRYHIRVRPLAPTTLIFYGARNDVFDRDAKLDSSLYMNDSLVASSSLIDFWNEESKGKNLYVRTLTYYFLVRRLPFLTSLQSWNQAHAGSVGIPSAMAEGGSEATTEAPAIEAALKDLQGEPPSAPSEIEQNGRKLFAVHLQALCDLARTAGTRLVLTTFIQDFDPHSRWSVTIRVYNELIRETAARNKLPLIDLESRFSQVPQKSNYFWEDHYHPNAKGAQFIASAIAEAWEKGWLEPQAN
jgi:lysophospholipase L1-like esterase